MYCQHCLSPKNKCLSLFIFFLFLSVIPVSAQKSTTNGNQVWTAYNAQLRLSHKWGVWMDAHLRSKENWVEELSQGIARIGLTYYVKDATKLTAGYAFVSHFPSDNHQNISVPEHRFWQQVQWHGKFPRLRTMQWLRLEERFRRKVQDHDNLAAGYLFNYRARFNFLLLFPIGSKSFTAKSLSVVLSNEAHVNFGKSIVYNYFDQNRFFLGFHYHVNEHDNLQVGYMNLFQQLSAGNLYRNLHIARIFYFHNLDLRR